MSKRLNAVAKAIADQNGWASYSDAQKALNAADAVMFSDEAIERAADAASDHWRHFSSGRCACGEFISKDPREVSLHLARVVVAALKGDA